MHLILRVNLLHCAQNLENKPFFLRYRKLACWKPSYFFIQIVAYVLTDAEHIFIFARQNDVLGWLFGPAKHIRVLCFLIKCFSGFLHFVSEYFELSVCVRM